MLWYKAWRDTRWRFLIGLGLLSATVLANVFAYPHLRDLLQSALPDGHGVRLAREIDTVMQVSSSFRGYIWTQLVRFNLSGLWTVFAVLLGSVGPFSTRAGARFTLSLPVSRRRVCAVKAATDLAELGVLGLIPLLLIPAVAPAVEQAYSLGDALVNGIQILSGGLVFYCLSLLLAVIFDDHRAIVIALGVAVMVNIWTHLVPGLAPFSPATVMAGELYFRTGVPAWAGIFAWLAVSAALLYAAVRSTEMRDF